MIEKLIALCLLAFVYGQQIGSFQQEQHPQLQVQQCSQSGCNQQTASIVLDSNWRWTHQTGQYKNCYTGNQWDTSLCPDPVTCASNCALEGVDYPGTYGITASGNSLNIKFVTVGQYGTNIGSRVYLMQDENNYQMFKLKNKEFTFDVDVSNLPCGLNGALYFVEMAQDGGLNKYPGNKAGAKYGTGYCDGQCPHDMKFINGEANTLDWKPSPNDKNAGTGKYGTCCIEMDIWESNSNAAAVTPHVCTVQGQYRCNGTECGDGSNRYGGVCDKDGCDFNSYRMGNKQFFGKGMVVDTGSKFTVVTQFVTADGTDGGDLTEIRRYYVQNGKVIPNSKVQIQGIQPVNSITDAFCEQQKGVFGDKNDFESKGGLKAVGQSFERGMVLVLSLWDDHDVHMLWLDSTYPTNVDPNKAGVARGPCDTQSGNPDNVEKNFPNSNVIFSNIKWGTLNSTFVNNLF